MLKSCFISKKNFFGIIIFFLSVRLDKKNKKGYIIVVIFLYLLVLIFIKSIVIKFLDCILSNI